LKSRILRALPALIVCCAASPAAHAQVAPPPPQTLPNPLTLPDAVAIALAHQPQRFIAADQTTSARGSKDQARALYFPTLVPTYSYQNRSSAVFGASLPGNEVTIVRGGGLNIGVNQTFFDSGQRELTNARARHSLDAAVFGEESTRQGIILNVTQDYFSLLQNMDQVKVAQAQVDRFQTTYNQTKAMIENQVSAPNDIYQAEADLASAEVSLTQAQSNVRNSAALMKADMGVATSEPVVLAPLAAVSELPPLPAQTEGGSLDDYLSTALTHRPDLRIANDTVESANASVKQAEIQAGLSLSATGSVGYQATNDLGNRGVNTAVVVTGSYPLFDAGSARGAVRESQANRDSALNQLAQTKLTVRREVEQAYNTRAAAYEAARLGQAAVTAAEANYNSAVAGRQEQVRTAVDVTTAQATLTQAESQYVAAIYTYYTADAALRHAVGLSTPPTTGPQTGAGVPVTGGPNPAAGTTPATPAPAPVP